MRSISFFNVQGLRYATSYCQGWGAFILNSGYWAKQLGYNGNMSSYWAFIICVCVHISICVYIYIMYVLLAHKPNYSFSFSIAYKIMLSIP